jgi:hypothetical protein
VLVTYTDNNNPSHVARLHSHPNRRTMFNWWDGGLRPQRPDELEPDREFGENDWLYIVGDKNKIYGHRIIPEAKQKEIGRPPRILERSPGHWPEFFNACKGGPQAVSDFSYGARLAEFVLLGDVAIRAQTKILWDGPNMKVTNAPEAQRFVQEPYRPGFDLEKM